MAGRAQSSENTLRAMRPGDIPAVLAMLNDCHGVGLRNADSPPALRRFLRRNPGLSVVASCGRRIVGCIFVGHDGRRGYLHHVAVHPEARREGVGHAMVKRALAGLLALGIEKVHGDVFRNNREALRFWKAEGWHRRDDLVRVSIITSADPNA